MDVVYIDTERCVNTEGMRLPHVNVEDDAIFGRSEKYRKSEIWKRGGRANLQQDYDAEKMLNKQERRRDVDAFQLGLKDTYDDEQMSLYIVSREFVQSVYRHLILRLRSLSQYAICQLLDTLLHQSKVNIRRVAKDMTSIVNTSPHVFACEEYSVSGSTMCGKNLEFLKSVCGQLLWCIKVMTST